MSKRSAPVFVTRKFPPSVGGMETLAAGVWRSVRSVRSDAILIANGGRNARLFLWLPAALLRLLTLSLRGRIDSVLTGDALMNAVVAPLLWVARVPRATMVMGLDVTFENKVYRRFVYPALRRTATVIAISEATADATRVAGVAPERIRIVRLGVELPPGPSRADSSRALRRRIGVDSDSIVMLTLGRLIRRKGVRWFIDDVMAGLPPFVHYVVAGRGPEEQAIRTVAAKRGLTGRVHLLGQVDEEARECLLRGADIFVQPNIPVAGDMEGFGLVTIEAALRGTPVVAAALEGIKDAVVDGRTGILLAPGRADDWMKKLTDLADPRQRLRDLGHEFQQTATLLFGEQEMGRELDAILGWQKPSQ